MENLEICNNSNKEQPQDCLERHSLSLTGFTLMELMIGITVLVVALTGLIATFIGCFTLNETSRNLTIALNGCQNKLEEIRNENFYQIFANYDGTTFEVTGLPDGDSEGVVEVDNTNPDILMITVNVCWRQKGGRVFGEDINLNGVLDVAEDNNENGQLDSPAQLVTLMTRR